MRDIQKHIDEHRFEELALDTIESALEALLGEDRIEKDGSRYRVKGRTSKEDALRKLEYDLYYIKHQSIFLDLLIIFRTAKTVLFRKGSR